MEVHFVHRAEDETLAVVAYFQPVTRAYVDEVRGVDSSYTVSSLVEKGLIDPTQEVVLLNTGEGLKTLDPLLPVVGPSHHVQPSLKSLREAGLIA